MSPAAPLPRGPAFWIGVPGGPACPRIECRASVCALEKLLPSVENNAMLATSENLQDFHAFAEEQLTTGEAQSMRGLFRAWLALRERDEVVADMQASDADIAAGRVMPADEAIAEVRGRLGIEQ